MKVSVIVPIYHVAAYIERCLVSVGNQSYTDMECILVDDCGNDDSIIIAEHFINRYTGKIPFRIIRHSHNKGLSAARNTGIRDATGDYVFFLDSDDAITSQCIERLVYLANKYPDADFVQADTVVDVEGVQDYHFMHSAPEYCNDKSQLEELIFTVTNISVWNRLVKRSFIINHSLFFPEGIVHEDAYWSYFLAQHVKAAAFLNEGTYFYFQNGDSISTSKSKSLIKKRVRSYYVSAQDFLKNMQKSGMTSSYQRVFLANTLIHIMKLIPWYEIGSWFTFWRFVMVIAMRNVNKASFHRCLYFLALMPPLCFLIRLRAWHWRLTHYVISRV